MCIGVSFIEIGIWGGEVPFCVWKVEHPPSSFLLPRFILSSCWLSEVGLIGKGSGTRRRGGQKSTGAGTARVRRTSRAEAEELTRSIGRKIGCLC